jgi:hypothetical protein
MMVRPRQLGTGLMRKIIAGLLAITIAAISIEGAMARKRDHPNSGYCLSGKSVKNVAKCKENGGRK